MKGDLERDGVWGYRFDDCEVDLRVRELRVNGEGRRLEPRAFDVLLCLLLERHRVVSREELRQVVWNGSITCAGALSQSVWLARKAIGAARRGSRIKTLNRVGYRFEGEVLELHNEEPASALTMAAAQLAEASGAIGDPMEVMGYFHDMVAHEAGRRGLHDLATIARALSAGCRLTETLRGFPDRAHDAPQPWKP